ncbi:MAG: hypothetical protein PHE55_05840 [Methylococcaceae bacterium]|nr:hypothetical protein [Methylococcaceae bacterium]
MNIYYVFAYDKLQRGGDYNWGDYPPFRTAPEDGAPRQIFVPKGCSTETLVDFLRKEAERHGKINLLRLCAHGDSGVLFLGGGSRGIDANAAYDNFQQLKASFDQRPGARREIKIHGCGVASDTSLPQTSPDSRGVYYVGPGTFQSKDVNSGQGYWFLKGLANATGAGIQGAVNAQRPWPDFRFRGPTIYAYPDSYNESVRGVKLDYNQAGEIPPPMVPD